MKSPTIYREYVREHERMVVRAVFLPGWSGVSDGPFGALVGITSGEDHRWRGQWLHAQTTWGLHDLLRDLSWQPAAGAEALVPWRQALSSLREDCQAFIDKVDTILSKIELADTRDGVR